LHAFARFALEGLGTPAPVAPTERLVVGGIYRHVRNPMYVAVLAIILGQALLFSSAALVAYAAIAAVAMVSFVK
ncbi:methyltransferase, partial [Mesorhizobium sp.]